MRIEKNAKKMFRVLRCVIYTIISKYVCIYWLGSEKSKLSYLRLGVTGRYKHLDKKIDYVLGFGILDILLDMMSCRGFLENNESIVILKCPHRMFEC